MSRVMRGLGRVFGGAVRVVRWSLASVEDEPGAYPAPMAGVDHGPVPSVRLRLDTDTKRPRRSAR
jgi:hypothetical protein